LAGFGCPPFAVGTVSYSRRHSKIIAFRPAIWERFAILKKLVDDTLGYVAVSRFGYDVKVFTDSEINLGASLSRHIENATALAPEQKAAFRMEV
jgi:hypothetical protein